MKNITLENLKKIAIPFDYGKAKQGLVSELEEKIGMKIPTDFKDFLLEWGGYMMLRKVDGYFKYSFIIKFSDRKGGKDLIGFDQSLPVKAIIEYCNEWGDSIPEKAILFEESSSGSNIFISMSTGSEGEVYYMERDRDMHFVEFDDYEDEEAAVEAFDPVNGIVPNIFTKLGNSFDEFIKKIEIVEEDEEGNFISVESL